MSFCGVVVIAHPPWLFGGHEQWAATRALGTLVGLFNAVTLAGSSVAVRVGAVARSAIRSRVAAARTGCAVYRISCTAGNVTWVVYLSPAATHVTRQCLPPDPPDPPEGLLIREAGAPEPSPVIALL